jgi:hypothetical protein
MGVSGHRQRGSGVSVNIRNSAIQKGEQTIGSVQFVVAQGLSYNDKVYALTTMVTQAAQSLELPHEGALAAEILYRIADEKAGAMPASAPDPAPPASQKAPPSSLRARLIAGGVWALIVGLAVAAVVVQRAAG